MYKNRYNANWDNIVRRGYWVGGMWVDEIGLIRWWIVHGIVGVWRIVKEKGISDVSWEEIDKVLIGETAFGEISEGIGH